MEEPDFEYFDGDPDYTISAEAVRENPDKYNYYPRFLMDGTLVWAVSIKD